MRYKEGDKVIIKSREWYNENKDESGIVTFSADRGDYNVTKEDERKNRQFARALAKICLYCGMDKLPIVVNSQQYEYFAEEWNKLIEEMKK